MDEIDILQEAAVAAHEAFLKNLRQRLATETVAVPSEPRMCKDCGYEIPLERLRLRPSAMRCVDCQEDLEHASARR